MASSKVSTKNPDLPRQPSAICSPLTVFVSDLQSDPSINFGSMSMDDLLKSIYSDTNQTLNPNPNHNGPDQFQGEGTLLRRDGSFSLPKDVGNRTVDEVWKEIVVGGNTDRQRGEAQAEGMTLEDFLTKAGAVREEDVRVVPVVLPGPGSYAMDAVPTCAMMNGHFQGAEGAMGCYVNDPDGKVVTAGGRGKRRAVEEPPVDKAAQQKQKRMIKNRESAARSRERKQAYTVELESLVTQLEEENARLLREEAEHKKERLKQLMQTIMPAMEKRGAAGTLRRVRSLQW